MHTHSFAAADLDEEGSFFSLSFLSLPSGMEYALFSYNKSDLGREDSRPNRSHPQAITTPWPVSAFVVPMVAKIDGSHAYLHFFFQNRQHAGGLPTYILLVQRGEGYKVRVSFRIGEAARMFSFLTFLALLALLWVEKR